MGTALHAFGALSGAQGEILNIIVVAAIVIIVGGAFINAAITPKTQARIEEEQKQKDYQNQARSCKDAAREEARWKERR